jgi:hypothetical protein
LVVAGASVGLLSSRTWARAVAIGLTALSAVAMFAFASYYSLWALIVLALVVLVIWAIVHWAAGASQRSQLPGRQPTV